MMKPEQTSSDYGQPRPLEDDMDLLAFNTKSHPSHDASLKIPNISNHTKTRGVYLISVIFSIFCTFSVFEVNMQASRIASEQVQPITNPPAKRAVFIVSDGTKADSLFGLDEEQKPYAPFLRSMIKERGSFGVSYTALPTESKICSTTLVSGYYLDLPDLVNLYFFNSALSDHLLNESRNAWSFGQPEIIKLFDSSGDNHHTVSMDPNTGPYRFTDCRYNIETKSHIKRFFENIKNDKETTDKMNNDHILFFIHLICVDTAGHLHRPFSPEYYDMIRHTDEIVKQIISMFQNYYQDNETAFFFTADHGQKKTGVHADDSPENIRTPFIAWGAGIQPTPKDENAVNSHDAYSTPWGLNEYERKDLRQIDIAPLIASVLGISIPVNNEGVVPLEYLRNDDKFKAESLFNNAKQICSSLMRRDEEWKKSSWLSIFSIPISEKIQPLLSEIESDIKNSEYSQAIEKSHDIIDNCLGSIGEYKASEKLGLLVIFSSAFVGWMIFGLLAAVIIPDKKFNLISHSRRPRKIWVACSVALLIFLKLKNSPWRYYIYAMLPIYFGYQIANNFSRLREFVRRIKPRTLVWSLLIVAMFFLLTFAFTGNKFVYLILVLIWAFLVIYENYPNLKATIAWAVCIASLAYILTFDKIEDTDFDILDKACIILTGINFVGTCYFRKKLACIPLLGITAMTYYMGIISHHEDYNRKNHIEDELSYWHQVAKMSLPTALVFPFIFKMIFKPDLKLFLFTVFASFSPLVLIQSLSYEPFFYMSLTATLCCWMYIEKKKVKETQFSIQRNAIIILIGYQILYYISYYGNGNQASIDSFKLEAGYRLLDGFNIPRLGAMMVLKFAIPFFVMNLFFQVLLKQNFPKKSNLHIVIFFISTCGIIIFNYFNTTQGDIRHPKLTISFPILTACILSGNVLMIGFSNLLLRNIKMENDEKNENEAKEMTI